jgi:tyrosine-protein kinase Etk/Wzc
MALAKIPKLNEEFDPKLFRYIVLRKLPLIVLIYFVFLFGGYLMLRYTQPIFEAKTIIQIETKSKAQELLDISKYSNEHLSQKLELLRSRVFIERVLSRLPLSVKYFSEGKFLNHELYTSTPFTVSYVVYNPAVYNNLFKLTYVNDTLLRLSFAYHSQSGEIKKVLDVSPGKLYKFDELELVVNIKDNGANAYNAFRRQKSYLFEIMQTEKLYEAFAPNISLTVLNDAAQTIQISVRDKNPVRAADIANEMASEFQLFDIERRSLSANKILEYIDFQLQNVFEDLLMYEDSISTYKRMHKVDDNEVIRKQNFLSQLNTVEAELIKIQMESNMLKSILDELNASETPNAILMISILSGSQYQTFLQSDIDKLGELVKKREQLLLQFPENSSFILSTNQQIEIQKNLTMNKAANIKNNTDLRIKELTRRYNTQYNLVFGTEYEHHFNLKRFERSFSVTEGFYNQLIEKKTEFSILMAGYVPENTILEIAHKNGERVYPSRKKVLLTVLVLSSFLAFVIVALKYFRFDAIVSVSEVSKYTSVPILGVLPKYASEIPMNKFIIEKYPRSFLAESLRAVRSNLQFIDNTPGPKVIAITSTISGEGKTFLAVNLAGVLAISGKKVIIIDSDMRKPTVHNYFHLKNEIGLSSLLSDQNTIDEAIQDIGKFDIKFITAGPIPPNPAELLSDERFLNIIEELKESYDIIIIDNPPIGLVSDAMKSMQFADYPLYVLKANFSKRNFLPLTEKMLNVYNIKSISIILNAYDKSISNVDLEKDLVYAYGYVKSGRKGLQNHYYDQDEKPHYTFYQKVIRTIKNSIF